MEEDWEGTSLEAIGRRLHITRQVFGLPQHAFCEKAGIPANTYNQYEKGRKRPSVDNAIQLTRTYRLTLDWIYLGDPSGLRYETADAIKALVQARSQH